MIKWTCHYVYNVAMEYKLALTTVFSQQRHKDWAGKFQMDTECIKVSTFVSFHKPNSESSKI